MAVNYNVVARVNPLKREEAPKFYVTFNSRGKRNLRYLAHRIADKSSLNEIDVKAVLEGFIQVIPEILADGYTVDLCKIRSKAVTRSDLKRSPIPEQSGHPFRFKAVTRSG